MLLAQPDAPSAPRGSVASNPDARDENRAQAGDPAQDRRRAIVRAAQTSQTDISLRRLEEQIEALKRPTTVPLFGLDGEPSADATDADKAEPAAARPVPPITCRQKQLLPRLAREFGVNPDEPELDKLGKAKAISLIGAMLDRVNAQASLDER